MTSERLLVERVIEATPDISRGVGELMPHLSTRLSEAPIDIDLLQQIVRSPDRDLFIARLKGSIVGSAVMNLIVFTSGKKAWLEDFVVMEEDSIRGQGVGFELWKEIVRWSQEHSAPLEFTSSPLRKTAHKFYHRQGANIKPTAVFRYET